MINNFQKCLEVILKSEGGYVNDPHDAGGETSMGISKRAYPNLDIKNLTKQQVSDIYHKDYWDKVQGDRLPVGLDLVAFDSAVNSGPAQSVKWLQNALAIKADGVLGPVTLAAIQKADRASVIDKFLDQRLTFLKGLSTWNRYGKGWEARVNELRKLAHEMK